MITSLLRGHRGRCVGALAGLCWLAVAVPAGASAPPLRLVDDLGKAIDSPLEVCFELAMRKECMHVAPRAVVRTPEDFFGLRVEGDDHGPARLRREDMSAQADGSFRVAVPRKALLDVARPDRVRATAGSGPAGDRQALTVSLYSPVDPSFREPAFRAELAGADWRVKIPAGDFVASLTQAAGAPDLHWLTAPPGAKVRLAYRPLQGWSLVVRCRADAGRRRVGGAAVKIVEALGFGRPERPIADSVSGAAGLALFSGIGAGMASLSAAYPGFLPANVHGISAGPGTFAVRDVALETGGRLVAHIAVHGRPLAGTECQVEALDVAAPGTSSTVWKGMADARGICASRRLAAGVYRLRLRIPDSSSVVRRWITIAEGLDLPEDVALTPARLSGVVRRRGQPAPSYLVAASALAAVEDPKGARVERASEATSDETGRYELTLWSAGRYVLMLRSPSGRPVGGHKTLTTPGDDDQTVDFELDASAFTGTVVDEAAQPVAGAVVGLTTWDGVTRATTDASGAFEIDVIGEGAATLKAIKEGYTPSEEVKLQVVKDAPIPPVTLVLKHKRSIQGTVVSAAGDPVAGALVTSFEVTPDGAEDYLSASSGPDGSFEVEMPPGPPRVFVDGPACPLSAFDLVPDGGAGADETGGDARGRNVLRCPAQPAVLEVTMLDERGKPVPHAVVILRLGGVVVPQRILAAHLVQLGLAPESDGAGLLVLAGLAPTEVDLYLMGLAYEGSIAAGSRRGFLTSVTLPALETTEIELTLPQQQ